MSHLVIAKGQATQLKEDLLKARTALAEAQSELAREQAAVNAFRMHCRLKLDHLVETLQSLREEQQTLLIQLELWWQDHQHQTGNLFDEEDSLGSTENVLEEDGAETFILPTAVPHDHAAEKRLYRELARRFHPDLANGSAERAYATTMMTAVNRAYATHDIQTLYDLAGELDPSELAELQNIETVEIRKLREQLLKCQQLQRKAKRQLQNLRQENTARLWRKAQELEENGENWWAVVQRELEKAIQQLQTKVTKLKSQATAIK